MSSPICRDTARSCLTLALCGLVLATGCAETSVFTHKNKVPEYTVASAENPITQILAVWQVAEGTGIDGKYTRGAAGQVFFITAEKSIPAKVNGKVRVYLFDDQGTRDEQSKPIHQFDFEPTAWETHLTHHTLGPAYRVFIPYTRGGTHRARCSLRVRFTQPDGHEYFSEMVSLTFPGTRSTPADAVTPETTAKKDAENTVTARGQSDDEDELKQTAWWNEPAEPLDDFQSLPPETQRILLNSAQARTAHESADEKAVPTNATKAGFSPQSPKWYLKLLAEEADTPDAIEPTAFEADDEQFFSEEEQSDEEVSDTDAPEELEFDPQDFQMPVRRATESSTPISEAPRSRHPLVEKSDNPFFEMPVAEEPVTPAPKSSATQSLSSEEEIEAPDLVESRRTQAAPKKVPHPLENLVSPMEHPLAQFALEVGEDPHPVDELRDEMLIGRQTGPRLRPVQHPLRALESTDDSDKRGGIIQTSGSQAPITAPTAATTPAATARQVQVVPLAEPVRTEGRTKMETFTIPLPSTRRPRF